MKKVMKNMYLLLRSLLLGCAGIFFRSAAAAVPIPAPRKILFIRIDRLGDMVLSTPALHALKENYPAAELCVLAAPGPAGLIECDPAVAKIYLWEPRKGICALLRLVRELRCAQFSLVIDPYYGPELKTAVLAFLSGASFRAGYDISGRGLFFNIRADAAAGSGHFADEAFGVLKAVGLGARTALPELFIAPGADEEARALLEKSGVSEKDLVVTVHAGGYYPSQRWPAGSFAEVIKTLVSAHNARIVLVASAAESAVTGAVLAGLGEAERKNVITALDLKPSVLSALIRRSRLFIGNNSGPLHLAAAFKVPTVSIMGPTDPVKWTPLGANNAVLRTGRACAGCGKGTCKEDCMLDITPDMILKAAEKFIA